MDERPTASFRAGRGTRVLGVFVLLAAGAFVGVWGESRLGARREFETWMLEVTSRSGRSIRYFESGPSLEEITNVVEFASPKFELPDEDRSIVAVPRFRLFHVASRSDPEGGRSCVATEVGHYALRKHAVEPGAEPLYEVVFGDVSGDVEVVREALPLEYAWKALADALSMTVRELEEDSPAVLERLVDRPTDREDERFDELLSEESVTRFRYRKLELASAQSELKGVSR
ncbi:MAG TPA: hypothetical protein VK116_08655 [Planctomycetota bacterium]|nr:hypothetical protein [Planctomycetota bacterium]